MTTNINSNNSKSNRILVSNPQSNSSKSANNNIQINKHNENNDWLQCVKWLIDCGCLSLYLVERYLSSELTLSEFANALRDGEILCNLANFLLPGSIDTTLINKRAHMSQMLCLKNIRLFLDACKSPLLFNMDESDLFDEHMLYEFDLARVIKALSILSDSKFGKERGIEGFNLMSEQLTHPAMRNSVSSLNSSNCLSQSNLNSNDDIYYNIMPTETETPDSFYTDASFLLGNQSLNENQNDNGVYQQIVQQPQHSSNPFHLKRDYVIREILNTEENFINGLNTLMDDFLRPLSKILNETDRKCICINIDSLIRLHQSLYDELYKAVQGGPG
jgi:guanine nucleotide exchange factor VAV